MNSNSPLLDKADREIMLRNALKAAGVNYKRLTLTAFVSYVCGVGSTTAAAICRDLGWNPEARGADPLPPYTL